MRRVSCQLPALLQLQIGDVQRAGAVRQKGPHGNADDALLLLYFHRLREAEKVGDTHSLPPGKEKTAEAVF